MYYILGILDINHVTMVIELYQITYFPKDEQISFVPPS